MTNQEICKEAADILRRCGWIQGSYRMLNPESPSGYSYCMIGACRVATGYTAEQYNDGAGLADLAAVVAVGCANPASWNDTPGRTVDEVIAALENCP